MSGHRPSNQKESRNRRAEDGRENESEDAQE